MAGWRLPTPMSREVAMPYGAGALVAGGLLAGDRSADATLRVDLHSGTVHRLGALVQPLHDSAGAVVSGRPVVVGGGGTSELPVVQQMNAAGHWRVVGRLPQARSDLSAVPTSRGLLVVGGYDGVSSPVGVLTTRTGVRFTHVAHLRHGVRYAAVARLGRYLWVLGGEENHRELDTIQRIDLDTGSVAAAGRMPRPLGHAAVTVAGGRLLVMGGRTGPDAVTDAMWWFDPAHGRWHRAGRLPYPVADAGVVTRRHAAYLLGGESPDFTDRVTRVSWTG